MTTSTLTYSQDLSSGFFSDDSVSSHYEEVDLGIFDDNLSGMEFDLREPEEKHSPSKDLRDQPLTLSESVVLLENVDSCSSPRNRSHVDIEKKTRDVSKLVDDLVGSSRGFSPFIQPLQPHRANLPPRVRGPVPKPLSVVRSPVRPRRVCPDGWIPHHQCDEFCITVFQQFSN